MAHCSGVDPSFLDELLVPKDVSPAMNICQDGSILAKTLRGLHVSFFCLLL